MIYFFKTKMERTSCNRIFKVNETGTDEKFITKIKTFINF